MTETDIRKAINFLKNKRGLEPSAFSFELLHSKVSAMMKSNGISMVDDYLDFLLNDPGEIDNLIDSFTNNVSEFFRDPLVFEMLIEKIVPLVIKRKIIAHDNLIRIWIAGCGNGEEAYSLGIIMSEALKEFDNNVSVKIFATDIDKAALSIASKGEYHEHKVRNVRLGMLKNYFREERGRYVVNSDIQQIISFSYFNLLDAQLVYPPESIFGSFDIVFCRNVLIYFEREQQELSLKRLCQSVREEGFLVIGESENIPEKFDRHLIPVSRFCKIFKKQNG